MIQKLGERGRMNSPMVSQSTAGRISESTTINENDVRFGVPPLEIVDAES